MTETEPERPSHAHGFGSTSEVEYKEAAAFAAGESERINRKSDNANGMASQFRWWEKNNG